MVLYASEIPLESALKLLVIPFAIPYDSATENES